MTELELIKIAIETLPNSYAPYSNFNVACAIETTSGKIYTGVNIENASYGLTICAERSAIANMVTHSKNAKIKNIVVISKAKIKTPPCGACRQVISEFSCQQSTTILPFGEEYNEVFRINFNLLLPHGFELND